MLCRVADEPVVVLKFPPKKPGNGVEGKTEMTRGLVREGRRRAKSAGGCKGVKFIRKSRKPFERAAENKPSRTKRTGKYRKVPLGTGIVAATVLIWSKRR